MEQMQASPSANLRWRLGSGNAEQAGQGGERTAFQISILVAEDDPMARSLMAAVLKLMGQEATFATNGREALDLVSQSMVSISF